MADIFISYARKDLKRIKFLITGLASMKKSIWWDFKIEPGSKFSDVIEGQLSLAKCIIVVWSRNSVKSDWVKNEARFGKEKNILIPVLIDPVKVPFEFQHIQMASFKDWNEITPGNEQYKFMQAVQKLTRRHRKKKDYSESRANYENSVFINGSFNEAYRPLFHAAVFTVASCGFQPRTTLDEDDEIDTRLEELFKIISQCKYGIHDISQIGEMNLFGDVNSNTVLEMGLFLGAQRFDTISAKKKHILILDKEKYRYQRMLSDLSGIDVSNHRSDPDGIVQVISKWFSLNSGRKTVANPSKILVQYKKFNTDLPLILAGSKVDPADVSLTEYVSIVRDWLRSNENK